MKLILKLKTMKKLISILTLAMFIFLNSSIPAFAAWTQVQKLEASDKSTASSFGLSLDVDGNYMVIGAESANGNKGAAYVFYYNGSTWSEQVQLVASDAATSHDFGIDVAIYGDTIVVGNGLDPHAGSSSGSAYVFNRNGTDWGESCSGTSPRICDDENQKLTASDAAAQDNFGHFLNIHGDYIVIGSQDSSSAGAAYIFEDQAGTWTQIQKIQGSDTTTLDLFSEGHMAINSDHLMIGAIWDDDNQNNSGSVYIYEFNGTYWGTNCSGTVPLIDCDEDQKITSNDPGIDDQFGDSIASHGEYLIVGSGRDNDQGSDAGKAEVFKKITGTWTYQQTLYASDAAASDLFGTKSIDMNADYAIISSIGEDYAPYNSTGASYLFENQSGTFSEIKKIIPADPPTASNDTFGSDQKFYDSDKIVVGSNGIDSQTGAAYTFDDIPEPIPEFNHYILILTLIIGLGLIYKSTPLFKAKH